MGVFPIRLVEVSDHFPSEWEIAYEFRAIEIKGTSITIEALECWRSKEDYKQILKAAKLVGAGRPVTNPNFVKPDEAKSGVYEMRAPKQSARLFFFYAPARSNSSKKGVVILLNDYWKTKSSKKEQDRAFERARSIMDFVTTHLDALYMDAFKCLPKNQGEHKK